MWWRQLRLISIIIKHSFNNESNRYLIDYWQTEFIQNNFWNNEIIVFRPRNRRLLLIFIKFYLEKYGSNAAEIWPTHSNEGLQHFHQIWFNSESSSKMDFSWPSGGRNLVDTFLTGFSLITQEPKNRLTWKLSQKISFAILRRMVYSLSAKSS